MIGRAVSRWRPNVAWWERGAGLPLLHIARVSWIETLAEPFGDAEVVEMRSFSRFGADDSALFHDLMAKLPIRTNAN